MRRFTINVNPDVSSVAETLPLKVIREINKVTSYETPGAYMVGRGPTKVYLFKRATQKFPTGLLKRVAKAIRKCGYRTKTKDKRNTYHADSEYVLEAIDELGYQPRIYQGEGIVDGVLNPYGLFWWPTGSGKTMLFSMLIKCYNLNSLILVHRKELLYQNQRSLEKITGEKVGIIGDGKWEPRRWTVGITNSFMRKDILIEDVKRYLNSVEYLLIDEAHHLGATSWWKIVAQCKNTRARHGFSGTCFRTDNADLLLLASTGDIISKYTTSYMIENGWLSTPHIYSDKILTKGMGVNTWPKVETQLIVENEERNHKGCKFIYDQYEDGKQILVMVKRVQHGYILKDQLQSEFGLENRDIRFMSGKEGTDVRERALLDYKYGVYPVLLGTSIYDEGVDLPNIGAAANMGGGDSDIKTVQKLGRAIRKPVPEGEIDVDPHVDNSVDYYDPIDTGHRFIKKHSKHRQDVYKSERAFVLKGEYNDG